MRKTFEQADIFEPTLIHLFDGESGDKIGTYKQVKDVYIATKKTGEEYSSHSLMYIKRFLLGNRKEPAFKGNNKTYQTTLIL